MVSVKWGLRDVEDAESSGSKEESDNKPGEGSEQDEQPSTSKLEDEQGTGSLAAGEAEEVEASAIDALLEGGRREKTLEQIQTFQRQAQEFQRRAQECQEVVGMIQRSLAGDPGVSRHLNGVSQPASMGVPRALQKSATSLAYGDDLNGVSTGFNGSAQSTAEARHQFGKRR